MFESTTPKLERLTYLQFLVNDSYILFSEFILFSNLNN